MDADQKHALERIAAALERTADQQAQALVLQKEQLAVFSLQVSLVQRQHALHEEAMRRDAERLRTQTEHDAKMRALAEEQVRNHARAVEAESKVQEAAVRHIEAQRPPKEPWQE